MEGQDQPQMFPRHHTHLVWEADFLTCLEPLQLVKLKLYTDFTTCFLESHVFLPVLLFHTLCVYVFLNITRIFWKLSVYILYIYVFIVA